MKLINEDTLVEVEVFRDSSAKVQGLGKGPVVVEFRLEMALDPETASPCAGY